MTFGKDGVAGVKEVYSRLMALKLIRRTGWVMRGVVGAESVADHTMGVAMLTFLLGEIINSDGIEINVERATAMAVFHETGEALIGDITPGMKKYIKDKESIELEAVDDLMGSVDAGERVKALVAEFCGGTTPEARLVRACDRLEMFFQLRAYESCGNGNLEDFRRDPTKIDGIDLHPCLRELAAMVLAGGRE